MNATKFTFDTEFRDGAEVISHAARQRQRKSYTQEEIDQFCARARNEGMKAGQVRAQEEIARVIEISAQSVRQALAATHDDVETLRAEAAEIALAAARKLARAALDAFPEQEIEAVLREAMHQALGEPRLVLRVPPPIVEHLSPRIAAIAQEEGFDGRVQIVPDPALTVADCRMEWRGGGAERSEAAIEEAIAGLITRRFSHPAPGEMEE